LNSSANTCVNPSRANFDAEYAPHVALPFRPTVELIFIIDAFFDFISKGNNAFIT